VDELDEELETVMPTQWGAWEAAEAPLDGGAHATRMPSNGFLQERANGRSFPEPRSQQLVLEQIDEMQAQPERGPRVSESIKEASPRIGGECEAARMRGMSATSVEGPYSHASAPLPGEIARLKNGC